MPGPRLIKTLGLLKGDNVSRSFFDHTEIINFELTNDDRLAGAGRAGYYVPLQLVRFC
jgi:hypothetical protein